MAFINISRKYVFLATARTGSTSCYRELEKISIENNDQFISQIGEQPDLYHIGLKEFLLYYPEYKEFLFFATVRNPETRLISAFKEFQKNEHLSWSHSILEFKNFEDYLDNLHNSDLRFSIHFQPQYFQLNTPEKRSVDKLIYFENLNKDFSITTKQLYGKPYFLNSVKRITPREFIRSQTKQKIKECAKRLYQVDLDNYYS